MNPRTEESRILLCSSIAASVGGRGLALYAAGNRRCVQWVTGRPPRRLGVGDAGHYRVPPMRSPWE